MQNTRIFPGSIIELDNILSTLNPENLFVVTGKSSYYKSGAHDQVSEIIKKYNVTVFSDFETNPNLNDVQKGIDLIKNSECDVLISIGGGSAIDIAKLINYYQGKSDYLKIRDDNKINNDFKSLTHICIPTTAGSGSEATHFAVMYIDGIKYSIANKHLIPEYVIIDPELHYSQSPYQKAVSGIDALAQSIESFWSVLSTKTSRIYSEKALKLIWANLFEAVKNGDELSHLNLAIGSNLAGKAINIAKTTAPHAFSYSITKSVGLPHGHAVSIFLPYIIHCMKDISIENCNDARGIDFVINILSKISKALNSESIVLDDDIINFYKNIGISIDMRKLNISETIFKEALKNVNYERLNNSPIKINYKVMLNLLDYSNIYNK